MCFFDLKQKYTIKVIFREPTASRSLILLQKRKVCLEGERGREREVVVESSGDLATVARCNVGRAHESERLSAWAWVPRVPREC